MFFNILAVGAIVIVLAIASRNGWRIKKAIADAMVWYIVLALAAAGLAALFAPR